MQHINLTTSHQEHSDSDKIGQSSTWSWAAASYISSIPRVRNKKLKAIKLEWLILSVIIRNETAVKEFNGDRDPRK